MKLCRYCVYLKPVFYYSGDEFIVPPPEVVHPSAGMISRRDAETIQRSNAAMFSEIRPQTNVTVPVTPVVANPLPPPSPWSQVTQGNKLASKGA